MVKRNPERDRTDILIVYNWMHVAKLQGYDELEDLSLDSRAVSFDLDSCKLIVKALMARKMVHNHEHQQKHPLEIIEPNAVGSPGVLMP